MSSLRDLLGQAAALATATALAACKAPAPATNDPARSGSGASSASPSDAAPPILQHPPSVVALDEPRLAVPHEESFRLLDAGRGDRSQLRYALAAGTAAYTARTNLTTRHLDDGQFTPPTALPPIRDGFAITTAADHPDHLALHALAGEAAQATADTAAYLAPWRTRLEGHDAAVAFDERGRISAIRFDDDPGGARSEPSRDELAQRLLAAIVPLPEEPVGAGASWRVVTILRQGPAYAKQTATYTLTSRTAAAWKLHVKLQRIGQEQHLADPSLPPGTSADLLALFRALEGDVAVDPAHPLITGGSLAVESRMHVRLQESGQPATEQMFEDTGSVAFALCQPAAQPAPAPAAPREHEPLGPCPAGFSRRP